MTQRCVKCWQPWNGFLGSMCNECKMVEQQTKIAEQQLLNTSRNDDRPRWDDTPYYSQGTQSDEWYASRRRQEIKENLEMIVALIYALIMLGLTIGAWMFFMGMLVR